MKGGGELDHAPDAASRGGHDHDGYEGCSTGSLFAPYYPMVGAACVGVALVGLLAVVMRSEKRAVTTVVHGPV